MLFRKCISILLLACIVTGVSACGGTKERTSDGKIRVSVTFDAMKEFVAAVGGELVELSVIIPAGTEPHDFEPKAQDLASLGEADLFVYNGLGMETWAEDAVTAVENKNLIIVEASLGVTPVENTDAEAVSEHGQYDPHCWLSLKDAQIEIENIRDALIKADPDHTSSYEKNSEDFIAKLDQLYNDYREKFASVEKKSFVTGHAAFAYLCRDFGLNQNSVEDVFAEGEPSAQQLTELVEYCKENQVTVIFAEALASPAVSQTLADEVGAEVKTIYTIDSSEDNKSYVERMEENLKEIYESLGG
jgi:zinc transport system substrate-binding protein